MVLECDKLYVDSSFKMVYSRSNSDFIFELPDDLYLPPNTKCFVDDITIPITYYSIEANANDKLYIRLISSGVNRDEIIAFESQNYDIDSFRDALQAKLGEKFGANKFTVEGSKRTNTITLKINVSGEQFELWTNEDLRVGFSPSGSWTGGTYDKYNSQSFNNNLKNSEGQTSTYNVTKPYTSGFIDFLTVHNLYLHSNLSSYTQMNHDGKCNIIKKICVTTSFGYLQNDNCIMENDYVDVSNRHFEINGVFVEGLLWKCY